MTTSEMTGARIRAVESGTRQGVSFTRLAWVGPLTVVAALAVNLAIKFIGQALDPSKYEFSGGMLQVRFPNSVEPVQVEVRLAK